MDAIIVEATTSEPVKEKRKYTKKADTDALASLKAKIHTATNLDDLKNLWNENQLIRENKELVDLVTDKKKHIQETELLYAEEAKKEKQLVEINLFEKMDNEADAPKF